MRSLAATAPLNLSGVLSAEPVPEPERLILAWGENSRGQCLGGDGASAVLTAPRQVPCRRPMRSLAVGWERSLLVDASGGLWGGGANNGHCLSEEGGEEDSLPLARLDLAELDGVPFEAVQLGREHALAVLEGGRALVSWAAGNTTGQAGHGRAQAAPVSPGIVHLGGVGVRQVACGEHHSLVLTVQGEVFAFGSNAQGALGLGRRELAEQAERVGGHHLRALPVRGIAAGAHSSMALSIGGHVFCWGCNGRGRLGLGAAMDGEGLVRSPVMVPGLPGMARAVHAGGEHSAVILRRGRLFLAGDNRHGQLGQRVADVEWTSSFSELPCRDYGLRVRTAALGRAHTLLLSYDGELHACGCNDRGQLGIPSAPEAVDSPLRVALGSSSPEPRARGQPVQQRVVVGLATCGDHAVVLALAMEPVELPLAGGPGGGRPHTSVAGMRPSGACLAADPGLAQTVRLGGTSGGRLGLRTIREGELGSDLGGAGLSSTASAVAAATAAAAAAARPSTGVAPARAPLASALASGCTSRLGRQARGVQLPSRGAAAAARGALLQPVLHPGVASSVGFAGLSVQRLLELVNTALQAAPSAAKAAAGDELRAALGAALASPPLLNASFCFPGLYRPRLDARSLLDAYRELAGSAELLQQVEAHVVSAAFEGLGAWAADHDEAASLVHRDQLRGLPALMLSPAFADPKQPQAYELMARTMRLVAWMPPEGRRELQEVIVDDCSEEEVLRGLVRRAREHCDETVRRAHQMQRLSPEIWEGLMLLQLLWGANEQIAQRLDESLRTRPAWGTTQGGQGADGQLRELASSLTQTLSQLTSRGKASPAQTQTLLDRFGLAAPGLRRPVPAAEFHLMSLAEELVPPELEFRLFIENASAGPITAREVLELPLYAARTDYGFEYVLPSRMRSFMANRNLVPVSYTRKVLQVENHHAQVYLQHQVARRVAADLEVLPGHEIHIDPALLFFILKVRRERLLEDTTAALQRATPEDLRRQLKVVFEGEQGVDEGGLAREFFRLLSARVFAADCGLFDAQVAQNARVLWFDKASACESTDFWLAGVILGLVVYNNMPGLDVRFPPAVFKKIKDEPLGLEDLRHVHPDTHLSLCSLLQWQPEEPMSEQEASALFEATFCLDFVVTYDKGGKVLCEELCPDGRERAVTLANRREFVRLYCEWLLGASVERQFEPFRKGVRRVCDSPLFNALDSAELELIVCGEQELDFAQLRRNAHYDGFQEDQEYVGHFWQLLLAFDTVQKKRFLSFVTGSDLAPVGGLQELQLVIQRNGGEPTERLPTAHTCFNLLLLPEYGSAAKLERMLTSAMQNAEGFGLE